MHLGGFFIHSSTRFGMSLSSLLIQAHSALSQDAEQFYFLDNGARRIVLFFSVCDGKSRARVGQVSGSAFAEVWQKAAVGAQRLAARHNIEVRWLRIDWVTAAQKMSWQELNEQHIEKTKRSFFRYGIAFDADFKHAFLEQELNGSAMLYRGARIATAKFNENNFMRYARIRYGQDINFDLSPTATVYQFATEGFFVAQDPSLQHIPGQGQPQWLAGPGRNGGRRQIHALQPKEVYSLVVSASEFLSRQVGRDGKFIYGYFPCFGRKIPTYNTLRHASTVYSMVEAWELTQDEKLLAAIQRALKYLSDDIIRLYPQEDGPVLAFNVDINDEIKLGANAVSLLAMVKYTEQTADEQYLPLMESLALGIAYMQDAKTGKFSHVLHANDLSVKNEFRTIYYDGEAAFGLIRLYGLTRDPRWLAIVEKGFDYFIEADHWQAHDHWLSYCANELTLYRPEEKYFKFGVKNIADYLDFIIHRITTFPTLLELSMAFYNMLGRIKKKPAMHHLLEGLDVEKFYRAMHHRAHYLLNGFFWPEFAMYYARPAQIVGSFFIRHHAFRVRIDDVEHYLSGFIAYWKMLKAEQESSTHLLPGIDTAKQPKIKGAGLLPKKGEVNYYFCNIGFGRHLTSIEHSSIKRANLFIEYLDIVPYMLSRNLNHMGQEIWDGYKNQGLVAPNIPLLNLYDDLLQVEAGYEREADRIKYDSSWHVTDVKDTATPHQRVRHPNGRMRMYIVWRDQDKTKADYINYFFAGKKIQRDKFNRYGQLMVSQYLGEQEQVLKEDCFNPMGQRLVSRYFDKGSRRLRLIQWFDNESNQYFIFDSEESLVAQWLKNKFGDRAGNVFFIDKHRAWLAPLEQLNAMNSQHLIRLFSQNAFKEAQRFSPEGVAGQWRAFLQKLSV